MRIESSKSLSDQTTNYYLNQIKKIPVLNAEEERALFLAYQQGNPQAKRRLIISNLKLVVSIAKRYQSRGLQLSDLIEEGNLGLIYALDKFDLGKKVRFATYATWWIRQHIEKALMNQTRLVRVPIYFIKQYSKYLRLKNQITYQSDSVSTMKSQMDKLDLSIENFNKYASFEQYHFSLDSPVAPFETPAQEWLKDEDVNDPFEAVAQTESIKFVDNVLSYLTPQQIAVLEQRFGIHGYHEATLEEIGNELQLTRERVRQIQNKALSQLSNICSKKGFYQQ